MRESDRRDVVLSGAEADLLDDALEQYDRGPESDDPDAVDDLESRFDTDLGATDDETFELSRAAARAAVAAIEAYEPIVSGQAETRLEDLRERFVEEFEFEDRSGGEADPEDEERYPGST